MRQCHVCGVEKSLEEFRRKGAGRRHYSCRECMSAWKRDRPADVKRRERRLYRERHPEKRAAHRAVGKAIARGKLVRPAACDACGTAGAVRAHHEDYERRLDVRWLCSRCHAEVHLGVVA